MASNGDASTSTAVSKDDLFIPLIDFSSFLARDPDTRLATAKAILHAFQHAGFLYLKNHSIPPDLRARIFAHSQAFFDLPQSQKDGLEWTTAQSNRGYTCIGREKVTDLTDVNDVGALREEIPDLKESYEIGREGEAGHPNHWPAGVGGAFKSELMGFHDTCKELHTQVMRAVALGMGLDESWFDGFCDGGDNTLRLLHYPKVPKSVFRKPGQVRAGVHSDYGSITLLFQDDRGGLQVQSPAGTFVDATPIPDTIVVNAGDLLARWSNDSIKSTKHRVVEPPAPEQGDDHPARYSIAYFCNPNFDRWIDAIPGTFGTDADKKYPGVNSGDYLVQRLTATH